MLGLTRFLCLPEPSMLRWVRRLKWQLKHFVYPVFHPLSNPYYIYTIQSSSKLVLSELWNRTVTFIVQKMVQHGTTKTVSLMARNSFRTSPIGKCNLNYIRAFSVHQTFSAVLVVWGEKTTTNWLPVYLN